METIKVQIDEKKAMEVRMLAMQIYGPKKGSISAAVNEALSEWVSKFSKLKKQKNYRPNWGSLTGALKEVKMNSVKLQHATSRERIKEI